MLKGNLVKVEKASKPFLTFSSTVSMTEAKNIMD